MIKIPKEVEAPYFCHVLVCVNDRKNERKSCAQENSGEIRLQLKTQVKKRWPEANIRVSQTGCLGVCEEGPNVMIYPQNLWFKHVTLADIDRILDVIGQLFQSGD